MKKNKQNQNLKKELKKDGSSYILEKKDNMNVPARIFLNDALFEKVENDAINQVKNVASLPGILGNAIAMSDMHIGYGFPIGGVAAFDEKKGCITPGGIGFDINCLPNGSKVMTSFGYYKEIQTFEEDFDEVNTLTDYNLKLKKNKNLLLSLDKKGKVLSSEPSFFMSKKHNGNLNHIKTSLGYSINCTKDHPILTMHGMKKSDDLFELKDFISIYPFEGVHFKKFKFPGDLISEEAFSSSRQKELKSRCLLPFKSNNQYLPIISKLFGYILGDGTIYFSSGKGFISAYGELDDLNEMKNDIESLGFSAKIYSRQRDHSIPTAYGEVKFNALNHELHISSRSLAQFFVELGYPIGCKTNTCFEVPSWIMDSPLWVKRLFLSGFFGAELSSPRTHTKTGFDCPTISLNKNRSFIKNGKKFMLQLIQLLNEFEINVDNLHHDQDYKNRHGPTDRLRLFISSSEENLLKLWSKIGFSYNKKRNILSQISILYIKSKRKFIDARENTSKQIKNLKRIGINLNEIQEMLTSSFANKRFIERHFYEKGSVRIPSNFISFKDYCEKRMREFDKYGCFFDKIINIEEIYYEGQVYDFNIPNHHNFIADNIIVSNCGVRLLASNLKSDDIKDNIKDLVNEIFTKVPSGVGKGSDINLTDKELIEVLNLGASWAVQKGYGTKDDLKNCESNGCLKDSNPLNVSQKARARGRKQLGTLGAGNHFIEIQIVDEIYDENIANIFGLKKDQVVVMIHSGSRGLGHQVCSDYLRKMEDTYPEMISSLPEKDLAYAPIESKLAKDYFSAMCAAANFAWCNRHIMGQKVREAFTNLFPDSKLKTVYDVAHNIAKLEEHEIDGEKKKVYVHRKGATRAFPAGHPELPPEYEETGQPVLIPGSMGTASYVLVGTKEAMKLSFGSSAHGAGRVMSRSAAKKQFNADEIKKELEEKNIFVKSASFNGVSEEAPLVYKDIDEVIETIVSAGLANKVVKLKPFGVIKG